MDDFLDRSFTRARVVLLVVAALVAGSACRERRSYDRRTPESTVASFFAALGSGRVPADLREFIADEGELSLWQLRCDADGCGKGRYAIVDRELLRDTAVLYLDYEIDNRAGRRVMGGDRSPVHLVRTTSGWKIAAFGARRTFVPGKDGKLVPADRPGAGDPAAAGADVQP